MKPVNRKQTAVAAFVKTPGLSPIKTRLANQIGQVSAEAFYRLSVDCIKTTLITTSELSREIDPIWAVAENEGRTHELWKDFPTLSQGEGGLASRLANIYSTLRDQYERVIFIGADSPLLSTRTLIEANRALQEPSSSFKFVLGPSLDGGFYLLGGAIDIPKDLWHRVEYSRSDTGETIHCELSKLGAVEILSPLGDVDIENDLRVLLRAGRDLSSPTEGQKKLIQWCEDAIKD